MNASARGYVIAAIIAALFVMALDRLVRADYGERNYEIFTEMVYSKAGESFARNAALPQGRTQSALPPGVVPRGSLLPVFGTGTEEAQRAGRELQSPIEPDDARARQRGAELYGIYCVVCHDAAGKGLGPVVRRGMLPPPSLSAERSLAMPDGEMFHVLTYGQGNMASYAAQLSAEERWQVIAHVRALQGK